MIRAYTKEDIPRILKGLKIWLQEKEGMLLPEYMDMNLDVLLKNYSKFFIIFTFVKNCFFLIID